MVTKEKIAELRERMIHHDVEDDTAVVTLTARELQELIDFVERTLEEHRRNGERYNAEHTY